MFERAFLNREEFEVLHEPMVRARWRLFGPCDKLQGDPWYFGIERSSPRFDKEEERPKEFRDLTYKKVRLALSIRSSLNSKTAMGEHSQPQAVQRFPFETLR
jgi:hypothetical protein